jgi:hypothetical protein
MRIIACVCFCVFALSSCSTFKSSNNLSQRYSGGMLGSSLSSNYGARLPQQIATSERTIVVDPRVHAWGAYDSSGQLVRAGIATAGADYCPDLGHSCRTTVGTFRVFSLGGPDCKSSLFPIPRGGAPMPYCMYFHGGMALHGVADSHLGEGNYSHGCVRMRVSDAEWLRYNFVTTGTKVIVKPY